MDLIISGSLRVPAERNGDLAVEIPEPEFHQVLAEWLHFFARSGHWPGQHALHVPTSKFEP